MHSFDSTKEIKKKSKKETVYDNENVIESNDEYRDEDEYTNSSRNNLSNQSTRIFKKSKEMFSRKDSINSSTEKRKKRSMFKQCLYIIYYWYNLFLITVYKICL